MNKIINNTTALLASLIFLCACNESTQNQTNLSDDAINQTALNEGIERPQDSSSLKNASLLDQYSYAYGVELAERFKKEGIDLNVDNLAAGMQDAYGNQQLKMSIEDVAATTQQFQQEHYEKKEAERIAAGEKNKIEGELYLQKNASLEGVVVTDSGLQYKVLNHSNSQQKPTFDDIVLVHYRATFIDGTEFDSTHSRNEAYRTRVSKLIPGWTEALQLMAIGDKWELTIPSNLAYGEEGSGDWVEPHAVLIFEVELLKIESSSE